MLDWVGFGWIRLDKPEHCWSPGKVRLSSVCSLFVLSASDDSAHGWGLLELISFLFILRLRTFVSRASWGAFVARFLLILKLRPFLIWFDLPGLFCFGPWLRLSWIDGACLEVWRFGPSTHLEEEVSAALSHQSCVCRRYLNPQMSQWLCTGSVFPSIVGRPKKALNYGWCSPKEQLRRRMKHKASEVYWLWNLI